jgi:hypothetical protein
MPAQRCDFTGPGEIKGTWRRAHANRNGMTVVTGEPRIPRLPWLRWPQRQPRERGDGHRLITAGALLLAVLGLGLLAVSVDAQYRYVLAYRHQSATSLIEATALDVGMLIFSLLALGLARKGLAAKTERALIVACAAGSALMNYAAADVASPRSVLAYCMPPAFLAVVVDRVVATTRRHVLGMRETRSPWSVLGTGAGRAFRVLGRVVLYALRLFLAPVSTPRGLRRWVLDATPLPGGGAPPEVVSLAACMPGASAAPTRPAERKAITPSPSPRASGDTKTGRFLALVAERYGPLAGLPEARVSPVATELAGEVGLNTGAARKALRRAVLAARDGSQS